MVGRCVAEGGWGGVLEGDGTGNRTRIEKWEKSGKTVQKGDKQVLKVEY
jgi:hypothetical protein